MTAVMLTAGTAEMLAIGAALQLYAPEVFRTIMCFLADTASKLRVPCGVDRTPFHRFVVTVGAFASERRFLPPSLAKPLTELAGIENERARILGGDYTESDARIAATAYVMGVIERLYTIDDTQGVEEIFDAISSTIDNGHTRWDRDAVRTLVGTALRLMPEPNLAQVVQVAAKENHCIDGYLLDEQQKAEDAAAERAA